MEASPDWMVEGILSVSRHVDEDRPAVWLRKN
jgi:hypothetical protein